MEKCRCPFHNCQNTVATGAATAILDKKRIVTGGTKHQLQDISNSMGICIDCLALYQQSHH